MHQFKGYTEYRRYLISISLVYLLDVCVWPPARTGHDNLSVHAGWKISVEAAAPLLRATNIVSTKACSYPSLRFYKLSVKSVY